MIEWVAAGFAPHGFWAESPRSFVTIMEGAARAAKQKFESEVTLAWHTAALSGQAQNGKLKKLKHYLGGGQKPKAQTPKEMIALLKGFEKHGMKIKHVVN